jgi:[acyl-carrier-protein] S-malonyltransferase
MAPAAEKLALELARVHFRETLLPVVTNVEATPNTDATRVAALLEAQVTAPVRFVEMVEKLVDLGVTKVLEVGTGRVLSGLVARTARKLQRACLSTFGDMADAARFVSLAPGVDVS